MAVTAASGSIDVGTIVSQLMTVERAPLQDVQKKISGVDSKISAIGKIKSALSTLQTAARGLTNADTWRAATGTSADDKAVGVTVTAGAPPGNFSIRVDQLARPQTAVSDRFDGADTVIGGGTLTIQMGAWDDTGNAFTADAERAAKTVNIPAGATLAQIRTAINAAAPGINATLVNDGGKVRLMMRGTESGAESALTLPVTCRCSLTSRRMARSSRTRRTLRLRRPVTPPCIHSFSRTILRSSLWRSSSSSSSTLSRQSRRPQSPAQGGAPRRGRSILLRAKDFPESGGRG